MLSNITGKELNLINIENITKLRFKKKNFFFSYVLSVSTNFIKNKIDKFE